MLWDRGEPNGYANHMTDKPASRERPQHKVLLEMAYGDHQVANVSTEVEARTIGPRSASPALDSNRLNAGLRRPVLRARDARRPGRSGRGRQRLSSSGTSGRSGSEAGHLFGTDPAPLTNTPPTTSEDESGDGSDGFGIDPHDTVIRSSPLIRKQIADFIKTNGKITNPCAQSPLLRGRVDGNAVGSLPRGRAKPDQENNLSVFALFETSQF